MKLPLPRDAFSGSKQTSQAALIDVAWHAFLSQFVSMHVTLGLLNSIVMQSHNALGKVPRYYMQIRKSKPDQAVEGMHLLERYCFADQYYTGASMAFSSGVYTLKLNALSENNTLMKNESGFRNSGYNNAHSFHCLVRLAFPYLHIISWHLS